MAHHLHWHRKKGTPSLEQATEARLQQLRQLIETGETHLTGRAMRYGEEEGGGYTGSRFRGFKHAYPELQRVPYGPGAIARAIERRKGPAYTAVYSAVETAMERAGFPPRRAPTPAARTVGPHEVVRPYCARCREFHTRGQHRFHGVGSFHRTHLFSFGRNFMKDKPGIGKAFYFFGSFTSKLAAKKKEAKIPGSFIHESGGRYYVLKPKKIRSNPKAKAVFVQLMQTAQHRQLTNRERLILAKARRELQRGRRRGNPKASKNPPAARGVIRMGKLLELRYHRDWGKKPGFYKHKFTTRPRVFYASRPMMVPANTVFIRG